MRAFKKLKERIKVLFGGIDYASPSSQMSMQDKNSSAAAKSPAPSPLADGDTKEIGKSSPHDNPNKGEIQTLSLPNHGSSASQLSSSLAIPHDSSRGVEHLRPPSPHNNNGAPTELQPTDEKRLLTNAGDTELQLHRSPKSSSTQTTHLSSPNFQSNGINFNNRQQVSIQNPTFSEIHGDQNIHYYGNAGPFKHLADHVMLDATYDSSARDPPPRCHPGTRQSILQSIREIIRDRDRDNRVSWLWGAAGVGKSAIMQTITEAEAEINTLGASLFFSRPNNRDDPRRIFTTIAYQLAISDDSYQRYLTQLLTVNPAIVNKTMEKQFNEFISVPFTHLQICDPHRRAVVFLDGLDECKGNQEQCRIIELIADFVSNHPTVVLQWIIASRPEEHLLDAFSDVRTRLGSSFWEQEIPIDSEQSVRDVEIYLHNEFTKVQKRYRRLIPPNGDWPSERQFLTVSGAASGLFIFASTVIRFIDDDENPVSRLNLVVLVLEQPLNERSLLTNPLALLDALYERILSEISSDTLNIAKLVLGYLIIRPYIRTEMPAAPFRICNILGLEQHALYGALRKLRSVLMFPEPEDALKAIRFLHASFSDYLKDEKRSHIFAVDLNEAATHLWQRFMTSLQGRTKSNSDDSLDLSWEVGGVMEVMQKATDATLEKKQLAVTAGAFWPDLLQKHLENGPKTPFRLLLSHDVLIEQLKQLDYSYGWTFFPNAYRTHDFVRRLEEHIPIHLHESVIQDVSLASLCVKEFVRSLYERRWITIQRNQSNPFSKLGRKTEQVLGNDLEKIESFLRENCETACQVLALLADASASKVRVTVVGTRPRSCVLLRDASTGKPLFCFPYTA